MRKTLRDERGFSLAEIMIAVFIVALMGGIAAYSFGPLRDKARQSRAKEDLKVLDGALEMYEQDNGSYPTAEQGLQALVEAPSSDMADYRAGGYLKKGKVPKDPWKHDYLYIVPGASGAPYEIICYGADGAEGGEGKNKDIKLSELE